MLPFRTAVRVALVGAAVLATTTVSRGQPKFGGSSEIGESDVETRRRLQTLVPTVKTALEGKNRAAQLAALGIAADFPPALAVNAKLPTAVADFLQRGGHDPALTALALRAYGRMTPDAAELGKVGKKFIDAESTEVCRAATEALATAVQNAAPGQKAIVYSRYFTEVATEALPLLSKALSDRDESVQRIAVGGVQAATRVITDLYTFDPLPIGDEPKPKEGASRFDPLRPVLRELAATIPRLERPLSGQQPATRQAAARAVEALAATRRTVLNTQPLGEPAPTDPFPGAWSGLKQVLQQRVVDPAPPVRLATVEALESLAGTMDTAPMLQQASADPVVFVRWATARALGGTAAQKPSDSTAAATIAALGRLSTDPDADVRTAALNAIARFGTSAKSAADMVLVAASRGDVEPRVAAIKALGGMKAEAGRTVPVLIATLQEPDLRLKRAAAQGLTRFGPDAKDALPYLRKAVVSDDPELRLAAAEAILSIERVSRLKEL